MVFIIHIYIFTFFSIHISSKQTYIKRDELFCYIVQTVDGIFVYKLFNLPVFTRR